MKIAIDIGHNCPPDTGAVGLMKEDDAAKEIGLKLISLLESKEHETLLVTPKIARTVSHSLMQRSSAANTWQADFFISIHLNAFSNSKAKGVETLVYDFKSEATKYANVIQDNLVDLGYVNRGVKERPDLHVLKRTNMPAVLIECGFVTSPYDTKLYNAVKIAEAISKAF
jgi:N-acetylmuramoyl-L-alanine amidase